MPIEPKPVLDVPDHLLTTKQLEDLTGIPVNRWEKWRALGAPFSPPFLKINGVVRYPGRRFAEWLAKRERQSTSDVEAA